MAKVEKKIIDKNLLRLGDYEPKDMYFNGEVNRAIWDGVIKFNRANYWINVTQEPIEITPRGIEDIKELLGSNISGKTDLADGVETDINYTVDNPTIEPNGDETMERNGLIVITQDISESQLTCSWHQVKDYILSDGLINKSMTPRYMEAAASGGYLNISLNITGTHKIEWASGLKGSETSWSPSSVSIEDFDGEILVAGARLDPSTLQVYAPSAGTTSLPNGRNVAVITYIKANGDDNIVEWYGTLYATQAENSIRSTTSYNAWSYAEPDPLEDKTIAVEGETVLLHGKATKTVTSTWSSGEPAGETTTTIPLYWSTNYGTFPNGSTTYTMTDEGTIELTIGSTDADRNIVVEVNNANADYYEKYEYTQSAKEFVGYNRYIGFLEALVGYEQVEAYGGDSTPSVIVFVKMCAVYSDGSYDESDWQKVQASNVKVTSASNETTDYDDMASLNKSTGVVTVYSAGTTEWEMPHTAFVVNSMGGTFSVGSVTGKTWTWSGSAAVEQAENIEREVRNEDIYNVKQPSSLLSSDTVLPIEYQAYNIVETQWDSDRYGDYKNTITSSLPIKIVISGSYSETRSLNGDKNGTYSTASFTVGANNSTSDSRTFIVNAYDSSNNSVITGFTVEQSMVQAIEYYWEAPTVNSLSFGEIPASGNAIPIYVNFTQRYMKKTGTNVEVEDDSPRSVIATSLSGSNANDSSPAIISGGYVGANSLGQTPTSSNTPIYNIVGGTYKGMDDVVRDFSKTGAVVQARNYEELSGSPVYAVSLAVDGTDEILPATTYVNLIASATVTQYYTYTALPDQRIPKTNPTEGKLTASSGATVSPTSITGSNKTVKLSFAANTESQNKEYSATITAGGKSATAKVTQSANINSWLAPTISGTWSVSNISAKGGSTTVRVPIVQLQVNTSGQEVDRYTGWADAIAIGGTASNGGSVSGGTISAPNLGQTATSERTIFTITSVKVVAGGDGKEYTISVSPSVAVKQNKNYQWVERSRSNVSITPQGNIPALGGSATLLVNAYEWVYYYWASAPDTPTNETGFSMQGYVTSVLGTITGSPIVGTGKQVTLTYNTENFGAARSITASLRAVSGVGLSDINISQAVTQSAASYVLTAGSDHECNATASTVYVTFVSSRNGKAWQPSFSANLSGVTFGTPSLSGTTYTVAVNIPSNSSSSVRDIVVTATQSRYSGDATATVTITQAGVAGTVIRTVEAYGSWNSAFTKVVNISAFLSNSSGSSVTFSGIKVELRRLLKTSGNNPAASNLVATASYSGSVTLAANGSTTISISDITHTMDSAYNYWLAAYATQTTETTYNEIEQDAAEG